MASAGKAAPDPQWERPGDATPYPGSVGRPARIATERKRKMGIINNWFDGYTGLRDAVARTAFMYQT
jgi:hypothetical protein